MRRRKLLLKIWTSTQEGMSLVSVLIAVGLLGVFAFLTMTSVSSNMFVRKITRIERSYENLDQALVFEIKDRMFEKVIQNHCLVNQPVNVGLQLSNLELIEGVRASLSNNVWTGTADESVKAAIQRCSRPRIARPVNAGDDYYFCMKFDLDSSQTRSGELKSVNQAFAEVKIELIDFNQNSISGPSLSCNTYRTNSSAGIRITYMTYLKYSNSSSSIIKEKGGFHLFPKDI